MFHYHLLCGVLKQEYGRRCGLIGVKNCPLKFCSARRIRLLLEMLPKFSGCSFARARTFLQVLACSVFSGGSFLEMLAARKVTFVNARVRKEKRCARI